jgi:pSer/pThr/pTyr-binding forkhead associated (FHA) protein
MGHYGHLSAVEGLPKGAALLVVKRGPNAGARFLLDRPITSVGRHSGSDIVLDDVTVSGRHAEFRWENDELHVVDVGSPYGTYVNRARVESATLANGDKIYIGTFCLVVLKPRND